MNDKKWEKFAVLGGFGFVALNVVATVLQGEPPSPDDSNEEVLAWFTDNDTSLRISALLAVLSIILLAWWVGSLWRRVRGAEEGSPRLSVVSLVGFTGAGVLFAMWNGIVATVALQVDEIDADTAKFFFVLTGVLISAMAAFLVVHLGAISALSMRTKFLPGWVTIIGLISTVVWLVATIATATDQDPFPLFGLLGLITWMIWIIGTSIHMWRTADAD